MSIAGLSPALRFIRKIKQAEEEAALSDAQLLERFGNDNDQSAFAALVRRHGPMIYGVCQRVLRDTHDAEDAFQATFLVLVSKAASIGKKDLLRNWLYGVACRISLRAKAKAAKRQEKEQHVPDRTVCPLASEMMMHNDLREVIDEELAALTHKYRLPLVLFFLHGMTKPEIAAELGWPEGTVSTRLARGKEQLRTRLIRRGVTTSAAVLAATLTQNSAFAAVPSALIRATIDAIQAVSAGKALAAGALSASVVQLAQGVARPMLLTRMLKTAILAIAACALLGGVGVSTYLALAQDAALPEPEFAAEVKPLAPLGPPRLTLKVKQGPGRIVRLTGTVANSRNALHTIEIDGVAKGSLQTEPDGSFEWEGLASKVGSLTVMARDSETGLTSNLAEVKLVYTTPKIHDFQIVQQSDKTWKISGRITEFAGWPKAESNVPKVDHEMDFNPAGIIVKISIHSLNTSHAKHFDAMAGPDGAFAVTADLPPEYTGQVLARPLGWWGIFEHAESAYFP